MTLEPSNEDRADMAQQALILFTTLANPGDSELCEDDPVDLIVNLCHYMRREGMDPYNKVQLALMHFDAEDKENVS